MESELVIENLIKAKGFPDHCHYTPGECKCNSRQTRARPRRNSNYT